MANIFIGAVKSRLVKNGFYKTKSEENTGTLFQFIEEMPDGSNAFYVYFMNRRTESYRHPMLFIFPKGQSKNLVRIKKSRKWVFT